MTNEEVVRQVESVLREVLDDESLEIAPTTTTDDVEDWDSLSHIEVIAAVEKRFNIKFSLREVMSFDNVGAMCSCILSRLNGS